MWCYTTDPNSRWELCDVPQCDYYIAPSWHQNQGDQAILVSPVLGISAPSCYMTYDVQIDGPNMTVEVFVNTTGGAKSISRIG